jgi:hypothetical protein
LTHLTPEATDPWLLDAVAKAVGERTNQWRVTPAEDSLHPWIFALPADTALQQQGWKLHVSSYVSTAAETLRRVLPPLVDAGVAFKVVGSAAWLGGLNRGSAGLSQVGKFITAYPRDDSSAVDLAIALDQATRGLRGPRIPSDRPVADGGVVFYRYGGFGDLCMQTRLGEVVLAVVAPDGRLIPDRRGTAPSAPYWVSDPFQARGLGSTYSLGATVAGRYRPVSMLARSPDTVVQLGLDLVTPRVCVLKRARRRPADHDVAVEDGGILLRREVELLQRLTGEGVTATLYDVVESDDELILVTEDLGGETLDQHVRKLITTGSLPSTARVVELAVAIADALTAIHDCGHVHGDLKSANVVLDADGRIKLIDFDLAYAIGSDERPAGAGTRGYVSPECRAGAAASVSDDIYALGAVLYLLITGAEPSRAPNIDNLLDRPPLQLNPEASRSLIEVMARCLHANRYGSAGEVRRALLEATARQADPPATVTGRLVEPERALDQARRAGDLLCAEAETTDAGLIWRSRYFVGKGIVGRDINTGMAGTILALSELVDEFGVETHRDVLRAGARTLQALPPIPGDPTFGLYVGDMGVVAALLRAGQVLPDDELVRAAAHRASQHPAAQPDDSPDLFHGIAGRLLTELLLWDETSDATTLERAVAYGDALLERREGGPGEAHWRIPPGYADLSGKSYLGYAHGAAGIADVLLDLAEVTGEQKYARTASMALAWITRQAVSVHSGLAWPASEGQRLSPPFWCHGATGIGRLFLHALPEATESLQAICRSVASGARWSGPTLCHGLAGNAEFLLDAGRALGDDELLTKANELMSLVDAYGVDTEEGRGWISEAPRQINPDYLVGFAGIPLVLLRLARPDRRYQLSRAGFRYRA